MKLTRKKFCETYSEMKKLRRTDPYEFEVEYNNWKREIQKHI